MTREELGNAVFDIFSKKIYISPKDRLIVYNDFKFKLSVASLQSIKQLLEKIG